MRRAFCFLDVLDLALGRAGSLAVGADSGLGQSGLRPLSHAVNRQPKARALSRITRRPRIDAAAVLHYSPSMAKKTDGQSLARGVQAASTPPATRAVKRAEARAPQTAARPSSFLDTRVVYCDDNLEPLAKLRSLGRREPLYAKTGCSK